MKSKVITGIMLTLLLVSMLTLAFDVVSVSASLTVHNVDTGEDFATIQEAIDANETLDGHTIFVEKGTYYEHVIVNKSISLNGENGSTTVIDGKHAGTAISIEANSVNITGFTIQNSENGIHVKSIANNISYNIVRNNSYGIRFDRSHASNNNIMLGNMMLNNVYNLETRPQAWSWEPGKSINRIEPSNLINNKPVYYFINEEHIVIDSGTQIGYLALINCVNITVEGQSLTSNGEGILLINTNNSRIENNNITNNEYGMFSVGSFNNTISGNLITGVDYGIFLFQSNANVLSENKFEYITYGTAVDLIESTHCNISFNYFYHNNYDIFPFKSEYTTIIGNRIDSYWFGDGIWLSHARNSIIKDNVIKGPSRNTGLTIDFSGGSLLRNNSISGFEPGFSIGGWHYLPDFLLDIDTTNTVNGRPIHYLVNQTDLVIDQTTFSEIGYLGIVNSNNVTVKEIDFTLSEEHFSMLMAHTSDSIINHVKAENIEVIASQRVTLSQSQAKWINLRHESMQCEIRDCRTEVIYMVYSDENIIEGNIVENSTASAGGIYLRESHRNILIGNTIRNNNYGIFLNNPIRNSIYHNNFVENEIQVDPWVTSYHNEWDHEGVGNYWSDYSGVDSNLDGIGDIPYVIDSKNVDNYPLMGPWSPNPDFILSAFPPSQPILNGESASYTVAVTSINGFNAPVTLSLSGLPNGAIHSFDPNPTTPPINGTVQSDLTISATSIITIGTYTLTISGTGGSLSHSFNVTLEVTPISEEPIASLSAFPTTVVEDIEDVEFNASASYDPDGSVVSYWYDYGDGFESEWIAESMHYRSYSDPGEYYARMKVKDNDGLESDWSNEVKIPVSPTLQLWDQLFWLALR